MGGRLPDVHQNIVVVAESEPPLSERDDVSVVGTITSSEDAKRVSGPFRVHSDLFVYNPYSELSVLGHPECLFFVRGRLPGDDEEYVYGVPEARIIELLTQ